MIRLLGPPPAELLARADREALSEYYDDKGMLLDSDLLQLIYGF